MQVGVLSDTHIHSLDAGMALAEKLLNGPFAEVDVILHAGDHVYPDLSSCFYPLPWYGVCGNMDKPQPALPIQRIVELSGFSIGMMHGWGSPNGIETRVLSRFSAADIDVLVFGHSHRPVCQKVGSILLFNPGSATDRRSAPHHTVGLLNLENEATGQIIKID
ncbi:MAG: metallophosphoesterase [Thermodesulfobacteriota bacterium]|nr:metallophosphoesterase [Thermodesulfobacteriota bacterium]